ncbi:hypothetical protein ORI20_04650 [Mycobacterium sp. CVI_P3]|uniref:Uncharacterized protein n=1 Tax=Mycobacterium pinniadriaticum TaxID=2994102 RepID=A0ABT3S8Z6_9MYCO|nr:hypothetical protein [Mycobacterium pinniadriaticum]MCX2929551.1 hypothetical protein [Mycobacterium pinniadriaticum]MCX2935975.1 hypothetical protein [Mycobacterium pinniadriaticum]
MTKTRDRVLIRLPIAATAALAILPVSAPAARADSPAPADFVALSDVDPSILQEIRYATAHDFIARSHRRVPQPDVHPHP